MISRFVANFSTFFQLTKNCSLTKQEEKHSLNLRRNGLNQKYNSWFWYVIDNHSNLFL